MEFAIGIQEIIAAEIASEFGPLSELAVICHISGIETFADNKDIWRVLLEFLPKAITSVLDDGLIGLTEDEVIVRKACRLVELHAVKNRIAIRPRGKALNVARKSGTSELGKVGTEGVDIVHRPDAVSGAGCELRGEGRSE